MELFEKNRDRGDYLFANINLLGKCNVDCYFCLGKDLPELFNKHNNINEHFTSWKNFDSFIRLCQDKNIKRIYITGQNTDSLLYKYLGELIKYLQSNGFEVGLRTNGYLAESKMEEINLCKRNVGYSIHSLIPEINEKIMGTSVIPDWDSIIPKTKNCRVSIVMNKYNFDEFFDLIKYLCKFNNVKYVQVRRISTDTRQEKFRDELIKYEKLYNWVRANCRMIGIFYDAEIYEFWGKQVCFWRTIQTSVNSINYFTDGTISEEYFIVEGYLNNYKENKGHH